MAQSLQQALDYVSKTLDIDKKLILSKSKNKKAIRARIVISRHCRQNLNYSYPRIAKIFGMHHSSIIHYM